MDVGKGCAIFFSLAGTMSLILALASEKWIHTSHINYGLWTSCSDRICHSFRKNVPAYIHATRAFMITAAILSFISFIGYFVSFYIPRIGSMFVMRISCIPSFVAGFSAMIAMTIFTITVLVQRKDRGYYPYNILEGFVSGPFLLISGLLASRGTSNPEG